MKANVCCVKYNPEDGMKIAVGSADHNVHSYDLRNVRQPLHVFTGHRKAVSFVKFLSGTELCSASTDSTLRLWDVDENRLVRMLHGHINEKNFVGLTVNEDFIACGSEDNKVYVYHKAVSKPMCTYHFNDRAESSRDASEDGDVSQFISAVCWKGNSST